MFVDVLERESHSYGPDKEQSCSLLIGEIDRKLSFLLLLFFNSLFLYSSILHHLGVRVDLIMSKRGKNSLW
jgi:hypothetical protein